MRYNLILLVFLVLVSCDPNRKDTFIFKNELPFDIVLHNNPWYDGIDYTTIYIEASNEAIVEFSGDISSCGSIGIFFYKRDSVWLTSSTGDLLRIYREDDNMKNILNHDDWEWNQEGSRLDCTVTSIYTFTEEDLGN